MKTLRERRKALQLTQAQLAAELGVTVLTVKRQEKRPEVPRLYDLALEALETRLRKGRRA